MSQNETKTSRKLEADLVIIGGGAAGLPAAVTAVENGIKKVIVLEKRFATGGNALRANHMFAAESFLQKKAGVNVTVEDTFKQIMEFHHYDKRVNPKIVQAYLEKSANTVQWLADKGVEFELIGAHQPKHKYPEGLCHWGPVQKLLYKLGKENGIAFLKRTEAKKILRDADGKVSAVLASSNNEQIEIKTKGVILCPGGFMGNRELLMRYFPYLYDDSMGSDGFRYTGDGIKIADEAGAVLEPWATMVREGGWCFGVGRGIPTRAASIPYAIAVNTRGERFKSEARGGPPPNAPSGGKRSGGGPPPGPMSSGPRAIDPVLRQPKKIMFALFDDKMIQRYEDEIAASVKAGNRNKFGSADVPEFRKFLKQQAMHSDYWVKIANNLNEIARYIGADPKVLKATVEEYNYYCYWGFDEAFLKPKEYLMPLHDPPYYAIRQITAMTETFGPLRVNEKMEVLNKDNKPIPGFYAAGAITSGFTAHDYGHGGYALGYCVNTGRIAAESAARSMKK